MNFVALDLFCNTLAPAIEFEARVVFSILDKDRLFYYVLAECQLVQSGKHLPGLRPEEPSTDVVSSLPLSGYDFS